MDGKGLDGEGCAGGRSALEDANEAYLDEFEEWLELGGASDDMIDGCLGVLDLYLNAYLLELEPARSMSEGCSLVDGFFGEYVVGACPWATSESLAFMEASVRKFYRHMRDIGAVTQGEYDCLIVKLAFGMPDWQAKCHAKGRGMPGTP